MPAQVCLIQTGAQGKKGGQSEPSFSSPSQGFSSTRSAATRTPSGLTWIRVGLISSVLGIPALAMPDGHRSRLPRGVARSDAIALRFRDIRFASTSGHLSFGLELPLRVEGYRGSAARGMSQKGGERAYEGRLGKDRSPRHSRHSIASEIGFTAFLRHSSQHPPATRRRSSRSPSFRPPSTRAVVHPSLIKASHPAERQRASRAAPVPRRFRAFPAWARSLRALERGPPALRGGGPPIDRAWREQATPEGRNCARLAPSRSRLMSGRPPRRAPDRRDRA
jgi:hypothetical protein